MGSEPASSSHILLLDAFASPATAATADVLPEGIVSNVGACIIRIFESLLAYVLTLARYRWW